MDSEGEEQTAKLGLALLTQNIEDRGVGQFADALRTAYGKCVKMSDERLKAALYSIGDGAQSRKRNVSAIRVQPSAPGRRTASSSGGRAPQGAGRPRAGSRLGGAAKRAHSLHLDVEKNRKSVRKH